MEEVDILANKIMLDFQTLRSNLLTSKINDNFMESNIFPQIARPNHPNRNHQIFSTFFSTSYEVQLYLTNYNYFS